MRDAGDGVYECEYHPMVPGKYQVAITWGGYAIPRRSVEPPHTPLWDPTPPNLQPPTPPGAW